MNQKQLEQALRKFLKAWEEKSINAVVDLLAEEFEYFETPLEDPLTTEQEIRELWAPVPESEANISLEFQTMALEQEYGLFRVWGTYSETDISKTFLIDRIFLLSVNEKGLITKFMQWRESKEI